MDTLHTNLKTLGLSDEEIRVYLAALEQGSVSVLQLAKATKIPRTTVYLLIDSLVENGLLKLTVTGKKKRYVPTEPREILILGKTKQQRLAQSLEQLEQEIPQLDAMYRTQHSIPNIQYYQGAKQVQKIYEDTLKEDKIYVHCMSQSALELMGDYLKKYFVRVIRRMIHSQEIVSDSGADKFYQQEYSTSRNQIVCIPAKLGTNTDYLIYGDKVAFITYRERQPIGVIIHDKEIAHFEKIRFQMIWKQYV
jgi:sugar-specific transcriptional regulator TrmB